MAAIDTFTVKEARRLTGFKTTYMLDYLYRSAIVRPSKVAAPGRGRRRLYTFADLVLLRSVHHLLSRGLPVRKLKLAVHTMRRRFADIGPDGQLPPDRYLITDGEKVYFVDDNAKVFDLTGEAQMAFAFMLDVETIRKEVAVEVVKLKHAATGH